jgi:hypothetical protein
MGKSRSKIKVHITIGYQTEAKRSVNGIHELFHTRINWLNGTVEINDRQVLLMKPAYNCALNFLFTKCRIFLIENKKENLPRNLNIQIEYLSEGYIFYAKDLATNKEKYQNREIEMAKDYVEQFKASTSGTTKLAH